MSEKAEVKIFIPLSTLVFASSKASSSNRRCSRSITKGTGNLYSSSIADSKKWTLAVKRQCQRIDLALRMKKAENLQ